MGSIYDDGRDYDQMTEAQGPGVDFYVRRALAAGGPVLELACGTGRITLPIAEAGVDITGLDLSDEMLSVAREKALARGLAHVLFLSGDARDFDLGRRFALIFFPANSFQHLLRWEDAVACLRCAARHLLPGGTFVCEVWSPSLEMLTRDPTRRYPVNEYVGADGRRATLTESNRYDRATQINHITWYYRREGVAGEESRPLDMRQFFPQEWGPLASLAGLAVAERYGDWDESPFTGDSPRQILFLRPKTADR